jgi:hypothetical protein
MKINQFVYTCVPARGIPTSMYQGILIRTDWNCPMVVRHIAVFFAGRWRATPTNDSACDGWFETWERAVVAARVDVTNNSRQSVERLDQLSKDLSK